MPLPSSLDYRERYQSLPKDASRHTVSLQANNRLDFMEGDEIIFNFHQTGYLVPDSLYLRFKVAIETGTNQFMMGAMFYTVFGKVETKIDDNTVDFINQYGQVQNMIVNLTQNVAQKYSREYGYGYSGGTGLEQKDATIVTTTATNIYILAGAVPCLLSNCEKLIPLWAMPKIQMIFTIDQLANIFTNPTQITSFTLSNLELCYDCITLGSDYDNKVKSLGKIYIESQSFSNQSVFLRSGANGSRNINFNSYLDNVQCAFITFSSTNSNKKQDAVDITNESGEYSMTIGNKQFPQLPLSALNNRSGVLMELKKCVKSVFGNGDNFSINSVEFDMVDNIANTVIYTPGKFILPFHFETIQLDGRKRGVSLKNQSVVVNIKQSVVQLSTRFCNMTLVYKPMLEIDVKNRLAKVLN